MMHENDKNKSKFNFWPNVHWRKRTHELTHMYIVATCCKIQIWSMNWQVGGDKGWKGGWHLIHDGVTRVMSTRWRLNFSIIIEEKNIVLIDFLDAKHLYKRACPFVRL